YLPDRVIPMLPERLSNGVCSLKPQVDRLTHSVFIQFDKRGVAKSARFARSMIRSAHRLTYKEAYAILNSPPQDRLGERLHLAWQLGALLRRKRFEHGALDFGYKVGDLTNRAELQRLLVEVRGKPEEQALKVGLLKSLKRARYDPRPLGHYGLAKTNYVHFTSPIRRYTDLVVHRALGRDGTPLPSTTSPNTERRS